MTNSWPWPTVTAWAMIGLAIVLSVLATATRSPMPTPADRRAVLLLRWAALWAAALAVGFAIAGLLTPSCAQVVDFPDSDPPLHAVCVPFEEAG